MLHLRRRGDWRVRGRDARVACGPAGRSGPRARAANRKSSASAANTAAVGAAGEPRGAGEIDWPPRREAAEPEGERLRRAPEAHAHAFARARPRPASSIIEAMAATAKAPLATPSAKT